MITVTYLALLLLLGMSYTFSQLALVVAFLKAALVIAVFMELRHEGPLVRLVGAVALFWAALLFGLTLTDYLTR